MDYELWHTSLLILSCFFVVEIDEVKDLYSTIEQNLNKNGNRFNNYIAICRLKKESKTSFLLFCLISICFGRWTVYIPTLVRLYIYSYNNIISVGSVSRLVKNVLSLKKKRFGIEFYLKCFWKLNKRRDDYDDDA